MSAVETTDPASEDPACEDEPAPKNPARTHSARTDPASDESARQSAAAADRLPVVDPRLRAHYEQRLHALPYSPGWWGWLVPAAVAVIGLILRVWNLGNPRSLIFDETYYAKDAYALLQTGYELVWPDEHDEQFIAGNPEPTDEGSYVVHPPLGKWLIAIGLRMVGTESAYGWRISSAVAGALGVLLVALIAQRMFRSVFLGGFAGLLTAVEGHHIVMSRVAMLDIFLMLFVLAAFGALLADRYWSRRRLAEWAATDPPVLQRRCGPWLLWRPWQLVAAVLLGCAVAVKLSGLAFIPVFGLLVVLWDLQARRTVGIQRWVTGGLLRDALPAVVTVLPIATVTYVLSWSGWLAGSGGWGRQWHLDNPASGLGHLVPGPLRSLWNYHTSATGFHTGLETGHDYASTPWTWLFMGRPVSMHYQGRDHGDLYEHTGEVCAVEACSSAIVDLANPLIWWAGLVGLVVVVALWLGRRDWRYGAILSGYLAGYAVWLLFPDRTMFFFYTISFHPFLILAVTVLAGLVLRMGTAATSSSGVARSQAEILTARQRNTVLVLCFALLAVAVSVFFWPVWTAELIPYDQWRWRMWIQSWI
ncbi:dolichyl-phosphate-mannose--protein mannosyltransferase [Nesterenkonia alba]|uniref:dolichyl-phosphate-mannose--protein mannosyltransferase n=1 Tax=Nesterenkonia alba TaxID=515814 RepID=UPI0003B554B7|nr:phospholipid carrier-dependent glycosyltransferase [Nesterenkonia alba]